MPLYNMPALAKLWGVSREMVVKWKRLGELPEPDDHLNGRPIWYEAPAMPELKRPGRKPYGEKAKSRIKE